MTLRARLFSLFPIVHLGLSGFAFAQAIRLGSFLWLAGAMGLLYLLPPLCYRLHELIWPVKEGRTRLDGPGYSPWWISYQIQGGFNAVPALESILRLIPGCYSTWLRLWGSQIGAGVVWTPRVEIADRALLDIGDRVIFGHRVTLFSHVIDRRKNGEIMLYVKRVQIGNRAFIGAGCRLGPGAVIADEARVPLLTDLSVNERFDAAP